MKTMPPRSVAPFVIACCLAISGLPASAEAAHAVDLSGCWEGRWQSCATGHNGPIKATLVRINDTQYEARFRGRFFKVIPFRYSIVLNVAEDGDVARLQGSSYLGRLAGGTYSYDAEATESKFTLNYSSCKDHGQFVLCRVCPPPCCD
jgi:hypothetical protein